MAGKPIPIITANAMNKMYAEYVQQLPVAAGRKTEYVSFTFKELMAYLNEAAPYTDEIRIYLGMTAEPSPDPGRVTTIIWPYKNGRPATRPLAEGKDGGDGEGFPPYDEGNGNP